MMYLQVHFRTLAILWIVSLLAHDVQASRPNVVLFLVDDLGWADLGCYGSTFHETPQIDSLAAQSVRFTNAYAACPVCSPTRASILTGRHPVRVGITDWIPGADAMRYVDGRFAHVNDRDELALSEITLAELLSDAGYRTWFLGKWHLGDDGFLPTDQGFDVNIGGCEKGSPPGGYYAPWKNPHLTANQKDEYLTTRLTDEAVALIDQTSDKPFFMMLSYYNVHTPITADERTIDHFRSKADARFQDAVPAIAEGDGQSRVRQDNPEYASMVAAVDTSVGRVMQRLRQAGVDDDTIVVFFSDNGGLCTVRRPGPTSNLPLRSGKGWLYEGGIREPFLMRLPKSMRKGAIGVRDGIAVSTDIAPTVLDLVGLPARPDLHLDGQSLRAVLMNDAAAVESAASRTLYWHYPHYHGSTWTPGAAIRRGRYKLIEFYEDDRVELYDLQTDTGESRDRSEENPRRRDALRSELRRWQSEMNATMPSPR